MRVKRKEEEQHANFPNRIITPGTHTVVRVHRDNASTLEFYRGADLVELRGNGKYKWHSRC